MGGYLPYLGIGISLAGIGYLALRAWPRIKALPPEIVPPEIGAWALGLRLKEYARRSQPALMAFVAKVLHRSRLMTLKTDNRLSAWIERLKNRSRLVSARSRSWILERGLARRMQPKISFADLAQEQMKTKEEELLNRVKENPKNAELYRELAELYEKMGNLDDAREAHLAAEKLTRKRTKKTAALA